MPRHTETTRAKSPESWGWAIEHPDPPVPKWWVPTWAHKFVQYKWARRITIGLPTLFVIVCIVFPRVALTFALCVLELIRQDWDTRIHRKRVVKPLAKALAPMLGITWKSYLRWLYIPADMDDDEANAILKVPEEWAGREEQRVEVAALFNRRLPGSWEPHFHHATFTVDFTHPPPPPESYEYDQTVEVPEGIIPFALASRGKRIDIDLDGMTPHVGVFARTGWGKSVTLRGLICRARKQGAIIDICDPKRTSLLEFKGVPGITIHTGIDRMLAAIHAFYMEVERRYKIVEESGGEDLDPKEYPRRILVLEEMGSLVTEGRMKWRKDGNSGTVPDFIMDYARILWQGRAARMNVFVGAHQASAEVLINDDLRSQFGLMIASGPQSLGAWRKMYGNEPKMKMRNRKGAGVVNLGDELVRVTLQHTTKERARQIAMSASVPVDLPDPALAGQTPSNVPVLVDDDALVVGMKAGAKFLGMSVHAFTKARQREPRGQLHGEQRRGRSPAWTPDVLVSWHRLRVRAGQRDVPEGGVDAA